MIQKQEHPLLLAINVLKRKTKPKRVGGLVEHTNTLERMSPVDSGNFPFKQFEENNKLIRVFEETIDPDELIWHQDREDRLIKVIEANGWGYQLDNQLPLRLLDNQELFIPRMIYHRVIKGDGPLIVEIIKISEHNNERNLK